MTSRVVRSKSPSRCVWLLLALLAVTSGLQAAPPGREELLARMQPYQGESIRGVDPSDMRGKTLCGYQGWFTAPHDGAGRGWSHYPRQGRFEPGHCSIDLWPDVTELGEDEKFATAFRNPDGSVAKVFSSHHRNTVVRHFRWMQEYGIDGAFVQRFAVETQQPLNFNHCNTVLAHCREGANRYGRAYAVMYDLSGLQAGQIGLVIEDWKLLAGRMRIGRDPRDRAYLHQAGKPVVAVWGVGFNDDRKYTLAECAELIRFLKSDPEYGGYTVMVGVPTGWRTLDRDSLPDPQLHAVLKQADIISPWTVGRYATLQGVERHAARDWKGDLEWCRRQRKEYLPVVFPGFSWHNLRPTSPLNQIPRLEGRFLWTQYVQARQAGATMVYQAMFDELDEGTAIFKCTNTPPTGASPFVTYDGLPSDHYLWLTGQGARLIRGEIEPTAEPPRRAGTE